MYINFNKLYITPEALIALCAIKQKNFCYEISEGLLHSFKKDDLTTEVKGKPNETERQKVRLSKKGEKLLINLSFEGDTDDETEKILEWLINIYKNKPCGIIKNKKETARRIQWWKEYSQIKGNRLALLLYLFVEDSYIPNEGESVAEFMNRNKRGVLSNMLDNVCWTPPNNFARHYTMDNSPLWRYYEDNKEYVDNFFLKKGV